MITTRTLKERIDTLERVRGCGMKVCCGGIEGMVKEPEDRVGFFMALANMNPPPESVPVNALMQIVGTPVADQELITALNFVRMIAVARILMPQSYVRLSAGRENLSDEAQALCFIARANPIFIGDELLTTNKPGQVKDKALFEALGVTLV